MWDLMSAVMWSAGQTFQWLDWGGLIQEVSSSGVEQLSQRQLDESGMDDPVQSSAW